MLRWFIISSGHRAVQEIWYNKDVGLFADLCEGLEGRYQNLCFSVGVWLRLRNPPFLESPKPGDPEPSSHAMGSPKLPQIEGLIKDYWS